MVFIFFHDLKKGQINAEAAAIATANIMAFFAIEAIGITEAIKKRPYKQ